MCGISGYIDFNSATNADVLSAMVCTMNHRGPDDKGAENFSFAGASVGLGQARLSIIDLSHSGHQPMHYKNLSIVFNGEIYNYKEIKEELRVLGHQFTSGSDTEVILHSYEEWGTDAVHKFIGMFAIALLDKNKSLFVMMRDRAGVKPFFYYWKNNLLLFASELKAFHQHPQFSKKINESAVGAYFDFGYIPAPHTIFSDCHKLEPGHILTLDFKSKEISDKVYWDVKDFYKKEKLSLSFDEAKGHLHELLISSCNYRMVADVPVGIFLSGGYDSTAVTAILQKNNTGKLKTFTIGFEEGNNEAPFAKQTAEYLGTDHTEHICTKKEAQDIIPVLPFFYDEPFADSSAIPTILVSRLAQSKVKVALSADAGDEVFAGYNSYPSLKSKLNALNRIPSVLKAPTALALDLLHGFIPSSKAALKHKIKSVAKSIQSDKFQQAADLFRLMNSLPDHYSNRLFKKTPQPFHHGYFMDGKGFKEEIEIAMAADYNMYLQNDILTKVDRATMSTSLEGREPFLDHRLLEFAAILPFSYKHDGRTGKRILKEIVHEYVPYSMMNRPKTGFSLPIYKWLREDLSYLLDEYLNKKELQASGLFNEDFIVEQVTLFREGKLHYSPFIWKILMFQMWWKKWCG